MRRLLLVSLAWAPALPAQQLGTLRFPTSASGATQEAFVRGVLYLHSFEYDSAARAFREAQRLTPDFALAYWGEAMTYTHPVWNEQDLVKAREALSRLAPNARLRRAKAGTPREQLFLDAVEQLYGDGAKARRDTLYAQAMEQLADSFPDDDEAQAFYALSLLGLSQGVRDVPTYMRAGAIAQEVLRRNADHPGGAHYTIHAFDDPVHAPLGLRAARLYAKIAPNAPHAQHMTTHIFLAMGMWDDVVSQNVAAAGHNHGAWQAGHYTAWLGYGLSQQGRMDAARAHLEAMRVNYHRAPRRGEDPSLLSMRAHYVINSERWTDSALEWTLDTPNAGPVARAMDTFAQGYAALKSGRLARAQELAKDLVLLRSQAPRDDAYSQNSAVPAILDMQLRALVLLNDRKQDAALSLLREAARLEDAIPVEFGPPDIVKPTHELLGEVLFDLKETVESQREFARALVLAPGRSRALLGLGRAAFAIGDTVVARQALTALRRNWQSADKTLPQVSEVDEMLSRLK